MGVTEGFRVWAAYLSVVVVVAVFRVEGVVEGILLEGVHLRVAGRAAGIPRLLRVNLLRQ